MSNEKKALLKQDFLRLHGEMQPSLSSRPIPAPSFKSLARDRIGRAQPFEPQLRFKKKKTAIKSRKRRFTRASGDKEAEIIECYSSETILAQVVNHDDE